MSDEQEDEETEDEYYTPKRADEVVPTVGSDAPKRPSMYVGTTEFEFSVTGAEGETIADVEETFERQLANAIDAIDGDDDSEPTYH